MREPGLPGCRSDSNFSHLGGERSNEVRGIGTDHHHLSRLLVRVGANQTRAAGRSIPHPITRKDNICRGMKKAPLVPVYHTPETQRSPPGCPLDTSARGSCVAIMRSRRQWRPRIARPRRADPAGIWQRESPLKVVNSPGRNRTCNDGATAALPLSYR